MAATLERSARGMEWEGGEGEAGAESGRDDGGGLCAACGMTTHNGGCFGSKVWVTGWTMQINGRNI